MKTGLLTAVAIAALACSGVAQASVITETFTGLIISGTDQVGAFGTVGASLAGDTVTFSFSYDVGLLQADIDAGTHGSGSILSSSYDQYDDRAGDSAFAESVTINSQTDTITNSSNSGVALVEGCIPAVCGAGADGRFVLSTWLGSSGYIQTALATTQTYSPGDNLFSQYEVDALVGSGVTTGTILVYNGVATDNLLIGNVSSESPATPEPTTWISLALGFGMVGLCRWRRNAR